MSYLDKHLAYLKAEGSSLKDQQFNTTANMINAHFAESPFHKVVQCNGVDLEIQLQDISVVTRSASVSLVENILKFILLRPNTSINIGDIIVMDNENWMVTDSISNNPLFPKAKIEKCNYTLQVQIGYSETYVGRDSWGKPVYDKTPTLSPSPCILKTTVSTIGLNQPINLPQGQVSLTIRYDDTAKQIKLNDNYDLYNAQYKVVGFDYTNIVNGVGCLAIIAERVVNT